LKSFKGRGLAMTALNVKTNTNKKRLCKMCLCVDLMSVLTNTGNTFQTKWWTRKFVLEKLSYIIVFDIAFILFYIIL
jgi:hypothetical protein